MNLDLPLSTASASKVFFYFAMPGANCLLRGGQRGSFCWLTELPTYSIPSVILGKRVVVLLPSLFVTLS
jgi:hypothetical protein